MAISPKISLAANTGTGQMHGRFPASLQETVSEGLLQHVPSPFGIKYRLNRTTGLLEAYLNSARIYGGTGCLDSS